MDGAATKFAFLPKQFNDGFPLAFFPVKILMVITGWLKNIFLGGVCVWVLGAGGSAVCFYLQAW